ncbi:MAG: hypothetical protein HC788_08890 [Sphingopyxis sp.]|nr:hypothetical protein [Sphingopyxis sp.]
MDDKRNLITAILLSVLILIGWNFIAERFFPAPPPVEAVRDALGPVIIMHHGAVPSGPSGPPGAWARLCLARMRHPSGKVSTSF